MKRTGFTLIELLIALAIGSMVLTILFNSLFQTIRLVDKADDFVDVTTRATIMKHQLEKDLMGAFIPTQAQPSQEEKDKDSEKTNNNNKKPEPTKDEPDKKPDKKKLKPLTNIFYGVNKGNQLDVLTFITNNPMSAYWGTGKAQPKIARIVYHLVEDKENKGFFTLMRQEDNNLEYDAYTQTGPKEIRSYELTEGIKGLSVKYIVQEEKEKPQKTEDEKAPPGQKAPEKPKEEEKEIRFKKLEEWNFEKDAELPKDIKRRIPNVVQITVTLWDAKVERETRFTFNVQILPDLKPIQEQKEPAKKTPQQPGQTPGKPGQQPPSKTPGGPAQRRPSQPGSQPRGPRTAQHKKGRSQRQNVSQGRTISQVEVKIEKYEQSARNNPAALQELDELFKEGLQS